ARPIAALGRPWDPLQLLVRSVRARARTSRRGPAARAVAASARRAIRREGRLAERVSRDGLVERALVPRRHDGSLSARAAPDLWDRGARARGAHPLGELGACDADARPHG